MHELEKIQSNRKENLKKIIEERFGNKIDAFADFIGRNKYVVYALLWDVNKPNQRNITDSTARLFEQKLNLEVYSLDLKEAHQTDPDSAVIPLMDNKVSNDLGDIYLHDYEQIKLPKNMFGNIGSFSDLIAYKVNDMDMYPLYSIGDIVIINRFKRTIVDDQQYLVRINGKFYIRTLKTIEKMLHVIWLNQTLLFDLDSEKIKVFGIVDVEIRKKLYSGDN